MMLIHVAMPITLLRPQQEARLPMQMREYDR